MIAGVALAAALVAGPVRAEEEITPELKTKIDDALKTLGCEGYEEAQQEERAASR